jgi:hypothetical protein
MCDWECVRACVQNREAKRGKQALGSFLRVFKKKKEKKIQTRNQVFFTRPDNTVRWVRRFWFVRKMCIQKNKYGPSLVREKLGKLVGLLYHFLYLFVRLCWSLRINHKKESISLISSYYPRTYQG